MMDEDELAFEISYNMFNYIKNNGYSEISDSFNSFYNFYNLILYKIKEKTKTSDAIKTEEKTEEELYINQDLPNLAGLKSVDT